MSKFLDEHGVSYLWNKISNKIDNQFSLITEEELDELCGINSSINNAEFVDLGLPSGLLWATKNLGAASPEDVGKYYFPADIEGIINIFK